MRADMQSYHEWMREMNYSNHTIKNHRCFFKKFVVWCEDRGVMKSKEVSQALIERYQKSLYQSRHGETGQPMTVNSQRVVGMAIHSFFRWMKKRGHLPVNPAADMDLPRTEHRLPQTALTVAEVEKILSQTDTEDVIGIRDRAIMEVLYSTGIRREELARLRLHDINAVRGTLRVNQGKGKRDRVVPIGKRAIAWVDQWVTECRPALVAEPDHGYLFVQKRGEPIGQKVVGYAVRGAIEKAKIQRKGACHLFRHAMACQLLDAGAEVKFIQQMLGHRQITSTDIYANLTIRKLRQIHAELHPAKLKPEAPAPKTSVARAKKKRR
jgi:integrase/recombinase XerD